MNHNDSDHRPSWGRLFFLQLALVILASVLATTGHLPAKVFLSPYDKLGHLLAYGGLSFLAVAYFGGARRWRVIACLLALSALEELSQRAFPTRHFDLGDLAMNAVGIVGLGAASLRSASLRAAVLWRPGAFFQRP